jgi:hypothetical protein
MLAGPLHVPETDSARPAVGLESNPLALYLQACAPKYPFDFFVRYLPRPAKPTVNDAKNPKPKLNRPKPSCPPPKHSPTTVTNHSVAAVVIPTVASPRLMIDSSLSKASAHWFESRRLTPPGPPES